MPERLTVDEILFRIAKSRNARGTVWKPVAPMIREHIVSAMV